MREAESVESEAPNAYENVRRNGLCYLEGDRWEFDGGDESAQERPRGEGHEVDKDKGDEELDFLCVSQD